MAEPTNPTSPEQILADVPGKWEKAKESGELLFFPSTERIVPGDFPVSTAERAERAERAEQAVVCEGCETTTQLFRCKPAKLPIDGGVVVV